MDINYADDKELEDVYNEWNERYKTTLNNLANNNYATFEPKKILTPFLDSNIETISIDAITQILIANIDFIHTTTGKGILFLETLDKHNIIFDEEIKQQLIKIMTEYKKA